MHHRRFFACSPAAELGSKLQYEQKLSPSCRGSDSHALKDLVVLNSALFPASQDLEICCFHFPEDVCNPARGKLDASRPVSEPWRGVAGPSLPGLLAESMSFGRLKQNGALRGITRHTKGILIIHLIMRHHHLRESVRRRTHFSWVRSGLLTPLTGTRATSHCAVVLYVCYSWPNAKRHLEEYTEKAT